MLDRRVKDASFSYLEYATIIILCVIPLFVTFPFRINLFLAWDGAFRMSEGQVPYRDFGMPLGYGFWIIPALFFKIFGATFASLLKAQAFINLIAGLTFRAIIKYFKIAAGIRFLAVLIFCISYSFINFWPWYNHTVFVYELLGILFFLYAFRRTNKKIVWAALSAFFIALSFMTKQDGGGLAVALVLVLLVYLAIADRDWKLPVIYCAFLALFFALLIVPFLSFDFGYWFNYGQAPHSSRLSIRDLLQEIFKGSSWIKFYLLITILLILSRLSSFKDFLLKRDEVLFALLTLGILVQAIIVQVTSYIPHNVNVYFHAFAFAFVVSNIPWSFQFNRLTNVALATVLVLFWWSGDYWTYANRLLNRYLPQQTTDVNQVSKNTWMIDLDTLKTEPLVWKNAPYKTTEKLMMPEETIDGINDILALDIVTSGKKINVLNMSELTFLAAEIPYMPEKGGALWFHGSVALFDREIAAYCDKIAKKEYDLILFEDIPYLNNFYAYSIQDCIKEHYRLHNSFAAPRELQPSQIGVYLPY